MNDPMQELIRAAEALLEGQQHGSLRRLRDALAAAKAAPAPRGDAVAELEALRERCIKEKVSYLTEHDIRCWQWASMVEIIDSRLAALRAEPKPCSVDLCNDPAAVRGRCEFHAAMFAAVLSGDRDEIRRVAGRTEPKPQEPPPLTVQREWQAGDPTNRDWTEDAGQENGSYQCRCVDCGNNFIGHKRRVVCRVCARKPDDVPGFHGMAAGPSAANRPDKQEPPPLTGPNYMDQREWGHEPPSEPERMHREDMATAGDPCADAPRVKCFTCGGAGTIETRGQEGCYGYSISTCSRCGGKGTLPNIIGPPSEPGPARPMETETFSEPEPSDDEAEIETWRKRAETNLLPMVQSLAMPKVHPLLNDAVAIMRRLAKERDELRSDLREAAGECLVDMPTPGTPMPRVLMANTLMRRERDEARVERDIARDLFQGEADGLVKMREERDEAREKLATAERDRDFAIASQQVEQKLAKQAEARLAAAEDDNEQLREILGQVQSHSDGNYTANERLRRRVVDLERDLASFRETHTRILDALGCPNLFAGDETLVGEIRRLKTRVVELEAENARLREIEIRRVK